MFSSFLDITMRFTLVASLLFCCCLGCPGADVKNGEVVLSIPDLGRVMGRPERSIDNQEYVTFPEIAYAHIAENGWFQPPIPVTSASEGIVNNNPLLTCPRWEQFQRHEAFAQVNASGGENEDFDDSRYRSCLLLKIDTKNVYAKNPVIVYLSGFDLESGQIYAAYGTYLMKKDVVLVSVQYRGDAFGYLSTLTREIPGNMAILDTIEALKWIQKYISYFGGDPSRVTLNGHYLAAGIIGALTASPWAEGLFHQVIYQSGSLEYKKFSTSNPIEIAIQVSRELGCFYVESIPSLNQCLLGATRKAVLRAYDTVAKYNGGDMYPITIGGPTGILYENYQPRKYPSIGGFVSQPAIYLLEKNRPKTSYSRFSKKYLEQCYSDELKKLMHVLETRVGEPSKLLGEFYGKATLDEKVNTKDILLNGLIKAFLPVEIDLKGLDIKLSVLKTLLRNKELGGDSYLFVYKYQDPGNFLLPGKTESSSILKNYVTLLDDLPPIYTDRSFPGAQKDLVNLMVDLWTSFAATGKPNTTVNWPQVSSVIGPYLVIDTNVNIERNLLSELTPTVDCLKAPDCEWAQLEKPTKQ